MKHGDRSLEGVHDVWNGNDQWLKGKDDLRDGDDHRLAADRPPFIDGGHPWCNDHDPFKDHCGKRVPGKGGPSVGSRILPGTGRNQAASVG